MTLRQSFFGSTPDGLPAHLFTLDSGNGLSVSLTNYGSTLTRILAPDRYGKPADLILGYDNLQQYLTSRGYLGAMIGRVANRVANASFTLDGRAYALPANNGPNTLHGGLKGFDKHLWHAEQIGSALRMTLASPDGDQGFPGNLSATVTYTLFPDNELRIDYLATTDKPTPISFTHHPYFNLAGAGSGTILSHLLTLNADHYTPVNQTLIPTGQVAPVRNTPFDFTIPNPIGQRIDQIPGGYDHNFCINPKAGTQRVPDSLPPAASVLEESTGRQMEILTDHPGIQFYSGNFLDGSLHGIGGPYHKHGAFCLEPQHYPDAVHHSNFPSCILRPGQSYHRSTIYRFLSR